MARTTLVRVDGCARNHLEHFFGLLADVLHPAVARNLIAHIAQGHGKFGLEQAVALALHQVFERIPHGVLDPLHVGLQWVHQRDFLLEHQGTARHGSEDRVAILGILGQHRDVGFLAGIDRRQVAEFQLWHAAALLFFHDDIGHLVVVENLQQIQTDARLVVVDVAGGKNGHLARRLGAVRHHRRLRLGCAGAELLAGQCR